MYQNVCLIKFSHLYFPYDLWTFESQDEDQVTSFFLIYINDIAKASSFHTTSFADDTNLHMSNSSFNVLQTTVNLETCQIDHWLRANKLSPNYNKTNLMLLNSEKHNPTSFIINYHSISPEDISKYLGVLLDNKLETSRTKVENSIKTLRSSIQT